MTEVSMIRDFSSDFNTLVQKYPSRIAFIVNADINPKKVTYSELGSLVNRCLAFFSQQTWSRERVILSLMPNTLETIVIFLAAMKGGYGFAPLPCTATKREIERWGKLISPSICVGSRLISDEIGDLMTNQGCDFFALNTDTLFDWLPETELDSSPSMSSRLYLATSGSTGDPKAIVLDANRLWSSGCAFMHFHGQDQHELCFWNYLPMSYLGGLFNLALIPLCIGATTVIDEPFSGKTFLRFWQTVQRFDISAIWLVPSIVKGLLKLAERSTSNELKQLGKSIRLTFLGTAPMALAYKQKFEDIFGLQLLENFALSETTFFSTETAQNCTNRIEGGVGELLPYIDLKCVRVEDDETGEIVSEICVKSPFLFLGYLQSDGSLSASCDENGYFSTGDLGHLNDRGTLVIDGRKRDIIKKGGYFVSLREIELLAEKHPSVEEAAAVKVSHEFYGETFILYVIPKDKGEGCVDLQGLNKHIHEQLVSYKWPEKIVVKDEFPRTASGKVRKHMLGETRG